MFHAILSTFKFFWKNKYLIGTNGPVKFLTARSNFVVFILSHFNNLVIHFGKKWQMDHNLRVDHNCDLLIQN